MNLCAARSFSFACSTWLGRKNANTAANKNNELRWSMSVCHADDKFMCECRTNGEKTLSYLLHFNTKNMRTDPKREIRTINSWTRSATEINIYKINGISSNHFQRIILFHDMPTHSMHWLRSCDAMLHGMGDGARRANCARNQFV